MATKPAKLCQLQKGIMVDSQQGFVDTFNWAVNAIANLTGGQNCEVTWPVDDKPTIDVTAEEGDGSGGGGGATVSAVYDVTEYWSGSDNGLKVEYLDGRSDTYIQFPNPSTGVQFTGTDGTVTSEAQAFQFNSASNSNVVVTMSGTTFTIGAFYL